MFTLFVLSLGCHYTAARLLHSLPDDTYAFPKFKTVFYNDLPLLNNTAQQWLRDGLKGGVDEFLDLPWQAPQQASIDASQSDQVSICDLFLAFEADVSNSGTRPIIRWNTCEWAHQSHIFASFRPKLKQHPSSRNPKLSHLRPRVGRCYNRSRINVFMYVTCILCATMETICINIFGSFGIVGSPILIATTRRSDNFTSCRQRRHQVGHGCFRL